MIANFLMAFYLKTYFFDRKDSFWYNHNHILLFQASKNIFSLLPELFDILDGLSKSIYDCHAEKGFQCFLPICKVCFFDNLVSFSLVTICRRVKYEIEIYPLFVF